MTRVALLLKKDEMVKEDPSFAKKKFLFNMKRTDYEREWGKGYHKPGLGARIISAFFRIIPKIGPFKAIGFKMPSPATETLYLKSINASIAQYAIYLRESKAGTLSLPNRDFDTGKPTVAGEYGLTDEAYANLLAKVADGHFAGMTPELRQNILAFFDTANVPLFAKKDRNRWNKVLSNIALLKTTEAQVTLLQAPGASQ
jgi:hypothetical protein